MKNKSTFEIFRGYKIDARVIWYSIVLWLSSVVVAGFVIIPWFYLILPIIIYFPTILYFKKADKSFKTGLWIAMVWFLIVAVLDFMEIMGPYYGNANLYFADFRNLFKYPLILLVPPVYGLITEVNSYTKKIQKQRSKRFHFV